MNVNANSSSIFCFKKNFMIGCKTTPINHYHMPHLKHYIENSILIPTEVKKTIGTDEVHSALVEDMTSFMETYAPMEQEILNQVNSELALLNSQIKSYLKTKEEEQKKQEIGQMEMEMAYI